MDSGPGHVIVVHPSASPPGPTERPGAPAWPPGDGASSWKTGAPGPYQGGTVALPDPHAGELTVEIDRDKYQLWQDAVAAAKAWMDEANRLRDELEATMGDAYAATVDGRKVITYRPKDQYAVGRLKADYPELVEHFVRHKVEAFVDMVSFAASHPDIAEKYRVRAFRSVD